MFPGKKTVLLKLALHYLSYRKSDLWKGAVAGGIGGLAGSGMMTLGQWAISRRQNGVENSPQAVREQTAEADPAAKVAAAMAGKITCVEPGPEGRKGGGALVHYAFGSGIGAVYGAVSELLPAARYAAGVPFGAAVWVAADLAAVPALSPSSAPQKVPLKQHAQMLGMHLAYGLATEIVRRQVRRAL